MRLLNNVPDKERLGYLVGLHVERYGQSGRRWGAWGVFGLGLLLLILFMVWRLVRQ
jgi:hypothetical protein